MYYYNNPVFNWEMDLYERQARVVESGAKVAAPVVSDVFQFLADTRVTSQSFMFHDVLTYRTENVRRWIKVGDNPTPSFEEWVIFSVIVTLVAATQVLPYMSPLWPMAFALDAYNIFQYFS